jgi:hypothetical protein
MSAVRDPREPADLPEDWWTTADVLRYLEAVGAPVTRGTWKSYVTKGWAPEPDRTFEQVNAWRPATIRTWHANRPSVSRRNT